MNSTFYNNTEPTFGAGWDGSGDVGIGINSTGVWEVKNNITMGHPVEFLVSAIAVGGGVTLDSNHNLFFDSLGGNAFAYNALFSDFATYQTNSGQDSRSLNADPVFSDAIGDDFTLQETSPAINTGTTTTRTTDFAGNSINGVDDIGAYEYQWVYPTAAFSLVENDFIVSFSDTSSDSDGSIVSWSWDFGDGSGTSILQNPSYAYSAYGDYNITLLATDNHGATSSVTQTVSLAKSSGSSGTRVGVRESSFIEPPIASTEPIANTTRETLLARIAELQAILASLLERQSTVPDVSDSSTVGTATCPHFTQQLSYGDVGPEVEKVQQFLANTGDFTYGEITGFFGPATYRAVQSFQARNAEAILAPWGHNTPTGRWFETTKQQANLLAGCA